MNRRCISVILASIALPIVTALTADAAPPFEYKTYRPGFTTLSEFRRSHKSIFEKYPRRNIRSDIARNIYESAFEISCDRPVKAGAFIPDLAFCNTYREDESEVSLGWDFVGGVLAYVVVYFPTADYDDTLSLLEAKYGKATEVSRGTARSENGIVQPYVQRTWKNSKATILLRSISPLIAVEASVEVSDDALYHRYSSLTSKAEI